MNIWLRLGDAARVFGDALATPRGTAPDRAVLSAATRGEQL